MSGSIECQNHQLPRTMAKNIILVICILAAGVAGYFAYTFHTQARAEVAESATLREQLGDLETAVAERESELESLEAELSGEVERLKAELTNRDRDLQAARTQLEAAEDRIEQLRERMETAEAERRRLENTLADLRDRLDTRTQEVSDLRESLSSVRGQLETANAEITALNRELEQAMAMSTQASESAGEAPASMDPQPMLPVSVTSKKGFFSGAITAIVANSGAEALTLTAELQDKEGNVLRSESVSVGATATVELEDGWDFETGRVLVLRHPDFEPVRYAIP